MKPTKEPLLGFAAAALALFLVDGVFRTLRTQESHGQRVRLSDEAAIEELARRHSILTGHAPTAEERKGIEARYRRTSALESEARRLGLDRNDTIIQRRLVQKVEFLLAATVSVEPPTEEAIAIEHERLKLRRPARARFEQVFVARHHPNPRKRALAWRSRLAATDPQRPPVSGSQPDQIGDAFPLGRSFRSSTKEEIAIRLGPEVANWVFEGEIGLWSSPLEGRVGLHLVRVLHREPERLLTLEEARAQVVRRLEEKARAEAVERAIEALSGEASEPELLAVTGAEQ